VAEEPIRGHNKNRKRREGEDDLDNVRVYQRSTGESGGGMKQEEVARSEPNQMPPKASYSVPAEVEVVKVEVVAGYGNVDVVIHTAKREEGEGSEEGEGDEEEEGEGEDGQDDDDDEKEGEEGGHPEAA
jgi:hypothetical protein